MRANPTNRERVTDYEDDYARDYDSEDYGGGIDFADPGGGSALRAATRSNPRNLPCPTCNYPDRLTPADRAQGYQCDSCANAIERGGEFDYYEDPDSDEDDEDPDSDEDDDPDADEDEYSDEEE